MTKPYSDLNDLVNKGLENKVVLVRVDFNSPMDGDVITDDTRIRYHAQTIQFLADHKARVVILAHQGRKGTADFHNLEPHAKALQNHVTAPVHFVPDVVGENAKTSIRSLKPGEILVLDNVRGLDDETKKVSPKEHVNSTIVKELAPLADYYVNDAFAAAHRSQASLTGFCYVLPCVAGLVMDREIQGLTKALNPEQPAVLLLGGTKIADSIKVASNFLDRGIVHKILPGGVLTTAIAKIQGFDIGENERVLEKFEVLPHLSKLKEYIDSYPDKWVLPIDVAIKTDEGRQETPLNDPKIAKYPIFDLGEQTIVAFNEQIKQAKTIVMNGPMGVYEDEAFRHGTSKVFHAVADSPAFVVAGGGHTIAALGLLGLSDKIDLISTGGGALISFLMGKELPVITALKENKL